MSKLTVALSGDTQIKIIRRFAAPPALVYRAHVEPDLIRQWMTGPEGWTMPECRFEAQPGGTMFMRWVGPDGFGFHATGEILEVAPGARLVHVERMFLPDPTPDNHVETRFQADGGGTLMTVTMTVATAEARTAMLATGMTDGMEDSYARIDGIFAADHS